MRAQTTTVVETGETIGIASVSPTLGFGGARSEHAGEFDHVEAEPPAQTATVRQQPLRQQPLRDVGDRFTHDPGVGNR